MADIASVSRNDLEGRRKKLRRQRQFKLLQRIWQTVAASGLAGGLLWVAIQPMWVLKTPEDVTINGNQLISDQTIQSKLAVSYPQSLWRIEPTKIRQALLNQPAIATAIVNRRLFPPGLVVKVEERIPVAIALQSAGSENQPKTLGLLDVNGILIPIDDYTQTNNLPKLQVIGNPKQYHDYWNSVYKSIRQSLVPIQTINFQDPNNLVLQTELGVVHLGAVSTDITEPIIRLGEMRNIYKDGKVKPEQVEYINLRNPDTPLLKTKDQPAKSTSSKKIAE